MLHEEEVTQRRSVSDSYWAVHRERFLLSLKSFFFFFRMPLLEQIFWNIWNALWTNFTPYFVYLHILLNYKNVFLQKVYNFVANFRDLSALNADVYINDV